MTHQLAVVFDWPVSQFFELQSRIDRHLFSCRLPKRLRPFHLPGIALSIEILVTLRATKSKHLNAEVGGPVEREWAKYVTVP